VRRYHETGEHHLDMLNWGFLPHWTKGDPKRARRPINAKGETVATSGMFRDAFARRRALIPAAAFYEWRWIEGGKGKRAFEVARQDGKPMAFVGKWLHTLSRVDQARNGVMEPSRRVSRRNAFKIGAGAVALPLAHIRTTGAAGRLSIAFWDHWVPGASEAMRGLVHRWAEVNKVEVNADFVTAAGNQLELLQAAESRAGAGHDAIQFWKWEVHAYADHLEPVDELIARLAAKYGEPFALSGYLAKSDGSYRAVPAISGSNYLSACSRIDVFRQSVGIDLLATFPAAPTMGPGYDAWTWAQFLTAAEACAKAGYPFGLPLGKTEDSIDWVGGLFRGFGAELVDARGAITVRTDAVRAALDYARRLADFLPADVYGWDNASNNRALISGRSALIFNPPSAWAVAVRDNPKIGEQLWTHPWPAGRHGRFIPTSPVFLGVWNFSPNKSAAKDLIEYLSQREQMQALSVASNGYDVPPFPSMSDFPIWAEAGPPAGTLYNYPLRAGHHAEPSIAAWPAPPAIAAQIYAQATMPTMIARVTQGGMSIEQSITLAEQELEGFMR